MRSVRNRVIYWCLVSLGLVIMGTTAPARAFHNSSWLSCGYQDGSYSLGFFGYRIEDHGIELGSLIPDEGAHARGGYGLPGYGFDYLFFKDLSEQTAFYGGIGVYRRYDLVDIGRYLGRTDWAYSLGAQHDFNNVLGLGFGYHSIRGVNLQVKLGF